MGTQWENLQQNLGVWEGSFTQFSPQGEFQKDTPSILLLEGLNDNQTIRLTLRRFSKEAGEPEMNELVRYYESIGRDVLYFDSGAFCQGSIQLAPVSEFGAEFSFKEGDRRLRVVTLYDREGKLASFTLIREKRAETNVLESPPLTVAALLGEWVGEAVTLYPDWRSPDSYQTQLKLQLNSENQLVQQLSFGSIVNPTIISSTARIEGSILSFEQSSQPVQVLLLPGGASATNPLQVKLGKPFFIEAGWLVNPDLRLRMIRNYNEKGEWLGLTLVREQKVQ